MIDAACCGIPKSNKIDLRNKTILPASCPPMNLASVEELATVGWSLVLYVITQPASLILIPVVDRRVLRHAAQFESADVAGSSGP